ncbi:MAG TPA: hypothetical protein PKU83_00690, partial [Chryseolinea sp.]|nr:hypothetical protein [Chryseolinea sp.]
MILKYDASNAETIIASSAEASATGDLTAFCSFRTRTSTTLVPDNNFVLIDNSGSDVVCPSPAALGEIIYCDSMIYGNRDSITRTVEIFWTKSTDFALLWSGTLDPGEKVIYISEVGWQKLNANGDPVLIGASTTPVLNNRFVISGSLYETFD